MFFRQSNRYRNVALALLFYISVGKKGFTGRSRRPEENRPAGASICVFHCFLLVIMHYKHFNNLFLTVLTKPVLDNRMRQDNNYSIGGIKMYITICDQFSDELPEKLSKYGTVDTDPESYRKADIVLVRSKTKCTRDFIDNAPGLKLIIRGGVGIDNIDTDYAALKSIVVRNTPKASAIAVAELAFSFISAVSSRIIEGDSSMKQGKWLKKELKRNELYGKTLCLIGMGNIAAELAKRAAVFGMNIVAYRKSGAKSEYADVKRTIEDAVKDADYISIHLPLNKATENIINSSVIDSMKPGVVIVNTARAGCVNPDDIAENILNRKISWYCSDVWPSEPPVEDYRLLKSDRIIATPHIGANTKENLIRIGNEVEEIIGQYIHHTLTKGA